MSLTSTPPRPARTPASNSFRSVLWAEWIKLRTVRGWIIALVLGAAAMFFLCYEVAAGPKTGGCSGLPAGAVCTTGPPTVIPTGPGGEAVADTYEFVHRTLTGDGTITTQITSLTGVISTNPANVHGSLSSSHPGLAAWAKAGLMLTPSTRQGSAYAAVMATGIHGIRYQDDYTHDSAGPKGTITTSTPRWLRLVRSGDTITGYASTDAQSWTEVGSVRLSRLPTAVQVGLFATSPVDFHGATGYPTLATATFDHITINDAPAATNSWLGQDIGTGRNAFYPTLATGSYHHSGTFAVISGSGDIAPAVVQGLMGTHTASSSLLIGLIFGLLLVIVVAAMFVTTEYRRGLIRTTFTAIPARGRVLVAKGLVVGVVALVLSVVVMAVIVPLGQHLLRSHGNYVFPATTFTQVRIVVGASALVAMAAIIVTALSAMVRRPAAAITAGTAAFLLPFIVASAAGGSTAEWLLRLTPAAGLSMLQALTQYGQVSYTYTLGNGYYPLSPLAGFAVLCGYTLVALTAATVLLHRRDA
jgi:ABC-type transport system involved in multi-copper enzyme maturation permease subunit